MQEVEPQAPPCTVTATGAKANSKRLAVSIENPRIVSDIRISDNVTISVAPKTRGDEEGDPFKPSRKIQRSPTIGGRPDIEVAEESVVYRNWIEISSRQDGGDSTYRKSYHKVKDVNMGKVCVMVDTLIGAIRMSCKIKLIPPLHLSGMCWLEYRCWVLSPG
ncbi:uncharacterized protein LOC126877323 [Bombus huntii]|uniref:uncharacterized protein LOC126875654 n=1 Tax=Bombus huntii TaxID=85661 RepID=UPI0021AAF58B|nr:uncharacterized protein LOC126875654 [Bombus huntii]XP_050494519.1 uncharacterized protein LOC126875673 [Bombus huntii]XP_050494546.1 uncharacterized protein LOC126875700 [Bombus huntii]XP_050494985.1 uncharacterized protein LOC126876138 [Bombus huntii]XP_050495061.1 uncharacterized protein LOC126876255 [Bombus huntii]XP_050495070.1 uncharacterized protein LOC126876264 [Bombus huntii]XP_050495072.1 uncharacterized protein LOC126876266 [Bombus huntii]XP_050495103.1 uncharacterized protein 